MSWQQWTAWTKWTAWTAAAFALAPTGCAAKKPVSYRFDGCAVTATWVDREGQERKRCECRKGRQIGIDSKTKAVIIHCE